MRILFAAGNNDNARIFLSRFMSAMAGTKHVIKLAAYRRSSPAHLSIDWTLDALLNPRNPDCLMDIGNDNFSLFYEQIRMFSPDLVISDLEYFCSRMAMLLGKPLWQVSPAMLYFALTVKEKKVHRIFARYAALLEHHSSNMIRIKNIIDNSDRKLILSHFADFRVPPGIKADFEFVRPYAMVGKASRPCAHNLVAACAYNNKKLLHLAQKYPDTVVFTEFQDEDYRGIQLKSLEHEEELACNLKNCSMFLCEGHTSFLADAYYNGKFATIMPNLFDLECVTNSLISEKLGAAKLVYDESEELVPKWFRAPKELNADVSYLHELISSI